MSFRKKFEGKAWCFGDNISTDLIAPGRFYHLRNNLPQLAKHVLEDVDKDFYNKISKGDFIVAGKNFGAGSSREHAARIIKIAGINAIIAKSFARIFYRNCINIGLLAIECNTENINNQDLLVIDLKKGLIKNKSKKTEIITKPFPDFIIRILNEGGLLGYYRKHKGLNFSPPSS